MMLGVACLAVAGPAYSGNHCKSGSCCVQSCEPTCCSGCGQKACRLICTMKKVKKTVWVVECEEFCVPNPRCGHSCGKKCCKSSCCTEGCGEGCQSCCDPCADRRRCLVPPHCGKVRCRKKLIKKEITCEVPVYKCVVCGTCCEAGGCCEQPAAVEQDGTKTQVVRPAPTPTAHRMKTRR